MIYILWACDRFGDALHGLGGIEARTRSGGDFELDQNPTWSSEDVVL